MCENEQKPKLEPESESWKESSGAGATLMKTNSSGDVAGVMKRRAPEQEPELCHFYDGSTTLRKERRQTNWRHS